jgi:transposase InsO family protein
MASGYIYSPLPPSTDLDGLAESRLKIPLSAIQIPHLEWPSFLGMTPNRNIPSLTPKFFLSFSLKDHPTYPGRFETFEATQSYCLSFFPWYNHRHLHSAIGFVTPADKHFGKA